MNRRTFGKILAGSIATGSRTLGADDFPVIDAHAHIFTESPALNDALAKANLGCVNVTVLNPDNKALHSAPLQHGLVQKVAASTGGRTRWLATFDVSDWESPGFARRVVRELNDAFDRGAAGVKIWKTIGMYFRSKSGRYLLPDDQVFHPIFEAVEARGKTLYAHLAEPIGAWNPLDPADPDYGYYKNNPAWHMHGKPGVPSKAEILAARDRLLAKNPKLRVVGCHLGSMEEDVTQVAARLSKYPNFVVDTAARVRHLKRQPAELVRDFLDKWQDRVLYGTDFGIRPGDDVVARVQAWAKVIEADRWFFASLGLSDAVMRKLFRENAEKWVPVSRG